MKASELIIELQKMIDKHGDLPVYWTDDEWGGPMYEITGFSVEDPSNWKGQISEPVFADIHDRETVLKNQVMDHDIVSTLG